MLLREEIYLLLKLAKPMKILGRSPYQYSSSKHTQVTFLQIIRTIAACCKSVCHKQHRRDLYVPITQYTEVCIIVIWNLDCRPNMVGEILS